MGAVIRELGDGDLGRLLDLWRRLDSPASHEPTIDEAVDLIDAASAITVVAEHEGELVGLAMASAAGPLGRLHRATCVPGLPGGDAEILDDLLAAIEQRLADRGVRRIRALAPAGATPAALERWEYREAAGARSLERRLPATAATAGALTAVGARTIPPGLWEDLKGLVHAKEIIERRVILPLQEPERAARHAVAAPRAIVLFGPPGTGKTTFAKGIASRLHWPFVEIQPRELAGEGPEHKARLLGEKLESILELPSAVVFVDEVEDLAAVRQEERGVSASVTNEFLKQIPPFRSISSHLLVCATNWIERLDPAFLRPGRFDYILPVGPPDDDARTSIWQRYVSEITDAEVAIAELVAASDLFTPADIEFAARKAAHAAFERDLFEEDGYRATTPDFLTAIGQTRPSLSPELVAGFGEDIQRYARY